MFSDGTHVLYRIKQATGRGATSLRLCHLHRRNSTDRPRDGRLRNLPTLRIAYTAGTSFRAGPWSPDCARIAYVADGRWVVNAD